MRQAVVVFAALVALAIASCPNQCSGHGRCGEWDKCSCFYRWMGNDCSQRICKEGLAWTNGDQYNPHGWAECSNKGVCDRSTGECQCFPEYEGAACERSSCPNDCSGHGTCEYAHEMSNMATTDWEYWKIQGCRCDGGYEGQDCSQRRCPIGDDPLTVANTLADVLGGGVTNGVVGDGDKWEFDIETRSTATGLPVDISSTTKDVYFFVEVVDLYGTTHRSRAYNWHTAAPTATDPDDTKFKYLLADMPCFQNVLVNGLTYGSNKIHGSVTLRNPYRVKDFRIRTEKCVDGCYPYMPAQGSASGEYTLVVTDIGYTPTPGGSPTINDVQQESAVCSNRGVCDSTTGQCQCFQGHYGLACEHQTILV